MNEDLAEFNELSDDWGSPNYTNGQLRKTLAYLDSQIDILQAQQEHTLNVIYELQTLAHQLAEAGATAKHGHVTIPNTSFTFDD